MYSDYCCFVDLRKAFDVVNRNALTATLNKYNIKCCFLQTLRNMYSDVHYAFKLSDGLTPAVKSTAGLKQGCILSPTLSSLYDLIDMFDSSCDQVELNNKKLSCLLYADDIVLMSNSASGLQSCMNKLEIFCRKLNLTVNLYKTNVMIFNKSGRVLKNFKFLFGGEDVKLSSEYKYLGILFKPSGVFSHAINCPGGLLY